MTKEIIVRKAVIFAARDLNIRCPKVLFCSDDFLPKHITAMFLPTKYEIYLNIYWVIQAKTEELIITSFYETRHAYQWNQIQNHENGNPLNEIMETIICWKQEFKEYYQPKSSHRDYIYEEQEIEKDAINYARKTIMNL